MANQLFIVCPFSCLETFLRTNYGNEVFFLTFPGAVCQFNEFEYCLEVRNFIVRKRIKKISIVNDTSCRLINAVINGSNLAELPSANVIEELYIRNYFSNFTGRSLPEQQYRLAELNIKNQLDAILNSALLARCISAFNIELKGIITSKDKKLPDPIQPEKDNIIHEL